MTEKNIVKPKITIVTVVLDADKDLVRTVESVLRQNALEYDMVIIEGGSPSLYFRKYIKKLPQQVKVYSEVDGGIYDAMNKGTKLSIGEWVLYLNAGDELFSVNTLKHIIASVESSNVDVIYGDFNIVRNGRPKLYKAKKLKRISEIMISSHQSIIFRREILPQEPYDKNIRLCADYDLIARLYKHGCKFKKINEIICNYKSGGVSEKNILERTAEEYLIAKKYFGFSVSAYLKYQIRKIKSRLIALRVNAK